MRPSSHPWTTKEPWYILMAVGRMKPKCGYLLMEARADINHTHPNYDVEDNSLFSSHLLGFLTSDCFSFPLVLLFLLFLSFFGHVQQKRYANPNGKHGASLLAATFQRACLGPEFRELARYLVHQKADLYSTDFVSGSLLPSCSFSFSLPLLLNLGKLWIGMDGLLD